MTTDKEKNAIILGIAKGIVDIVKESGAEGLPSGHLYAFLMAHGCTLDQYEQLMCALVSLGKLKKIGQCYFPAGEEKK